MWRWMLACAATACGHINFDPRGADAAPPDAADTSLIAHYRFDDDPAGGVLDSTGNNHTGGCSSTCPSVEPGKLGNAYRFNGTTDYIVVRDATELRPTAVTVTLWLYKTDTSLACAFQKRYGATRNSWQLLVDIDGSVGVCTTEGASSGLCINSVPSLFTTNRWHHLAYITTGTMQLGYLDGVRVTIGPIGLTYDAGDVLIGADVDGATPFGYTAGLLDDVRVYDRVLSEAEIVALAAQ